MYKSDHTIQFAFLVPCTLTKRNMLKQFITGIFKREKVRLGSLSIVFCSDDYILALNKRFLQHDYYTAILSFPLSAPAKPLEAEIYISIDRVRENAINEGVPFRQELHRVIFHGVFCGYKDKSRADVKRMRALEDRYLKKYDQKG
jgi:probable rRNA maturation factor